MKKLMSLFLATFLMVGLVSSFAMADAAKGQKVYLKNLKDKFDMNGTKFAGMHSQDEWKELFDNNAAGFIKEFSTKFPAAEAFLKGEKFQNIKDDVFDFAYKYANDSGEVPSC